MKLLPPIVLFLSLCNAYGQDTVRLHPYFGNLKKISIDIDKQSYDFLFDTGGGETFISPEIAKSLKRIPYGNEVAYRMNGEKLTFEKCDSVELHLGKVSLSASTVGVWDIMNILPKEFPRIDGVISLKSLAGKIITIDLHHNFLIIESNESAKKRLRTATLLESKFANGINGNELTCYLAVVLAKKKYWLLLDSGNLDTILLAPATARSLGISYAGTRVDVAEQHYTFGNLNHLAKASVVELVHDGALNYEFMSHYVFTFDLQKNLIWRR